jgi:hypothetical protein
MGTASALLPGSGDWPVGQNISGDQNAGLRDVPPCSSERKDVSEILYRLHRGRLTNGIEVGSHCEIGRYEGEGQEEKETLNVLLD